MTITCSESETAVQPASYPDRARATSLTTTGDRPETGADQAADDLMLEGGDGVDFREAPVQ